MTIVVLAHASDGEALAQHVEDDLTRAGFSVRRSSGQLGRRVHAAALETAHRVVVIWSRAARSAPALKAAVRRANARGTLVCVPLDSAPPPPGAKLLTRMPRGRAAWRKALGPRRVTQDTAPLPMSARPSRARRDPALRVTQQFRMTPLPRARSRFAPVLSAVAALVLIAAALGAEALNRDANLSARVQGWAGAAFAEIVR